DGQHVEGLEEADVVLVGVSRTSKTPTSIYLANRGIRTANVPLVPGISIPHQLETLKKPLVVSLHATPERLIQVRQNRLLSMGAGPGNDDYIDRQAVDERAIQKQSGLKRPAEVAMLLALEKARAVASRHPDRIILGADQTLALGDRLFDKPAGRREAAAQLRALSGNTHELHSAFALINRGEVLDQKVSPARMT